MTSVAVRMLAASAIMGASLVARAAPPLKQIATNYAALNVKALDWSVDDRFIASAQTSLTLSPALLICSFSNNLLSAVATQNFPTTRTTLSVDWHGAAHIVALGLTSELNEPAIFSYTFDPASHAIVSTNTAHLPYPKAGNAVAWRPATWQLAAGSDWSSYPNGQLWLMNFAANPALTDTTYTAFSAAQTVQPGALAWSPNGQYLAMGLSTESESLQIASYNGLTFSHLAKAVPAGGRAVQTLAWHPATNIIATGSDAVGGRALNLFSLTTGGVPLLTVVTNIGNPSTNKIVTGIDWASSFDLLAAGLGDVTASGSELRLYRYDRAARTLTLLYENENTVPVTAVKFSHDGRFLAVGDDSGFVKIFRVPFSDLAISKTGTPAMVRPGATNIVFKIAVTNKGPDVADLVTITDFLPTNIVMAASNMTNFVKIGAGTGTTVIATNGMLLCTISNLFVGHVATVSVGVAVSTSAFGQVANVATVQAITPDSSSGNNTAFSIIPIDTEGDGIPDLIDPAPFVTNGPVVLDFEGDARSDIAVFYPAGGAWNVMKSSVPQSIAMQFGFSGCKPVAADYDGDRLADYALFHPPSGNWHIKFSGSTNILIKNWGWSRNIAVPGDYDGDKKTDLAVYDPPTTNWYILRSSDGQLLQLMWGNGMAIPVPGDYEGDGKTDVGTYDPNTGTWLILKSSNYSYLLQNWGWFKAIPVPADYDGDKKTDIAVYVPDSGQWSILQSSNGGLRQLNWGWSKSVPVPADYDGDGKADIAVFAPSEGNWYILPSSTGVLRKQNWGWSQSLPVAPQVQINRYYFPSP